MARTGVLANAPLFVPWQRVGGVIKQAEGGEGRGRELFPVHRRSEFKHNFLLKWLICEAHLKYCSLKPIDNAMPRMI
jgi:hypothetical protein